MTSKNLPAVLGSEFAILDPQTNVQDVMDIMKMNFGEETLSIRSLDQIKIPGAGGTSWEVPTVNGDIQTKSLDGIILFTKNERVYWEADYGEGNSSPPDCFSSDLVNGHGNPGVKCVDCPFSKFESASKGSGQKCQQRRIIFFLLPDMILPVTISIPPSSLENSKKYLMRLMSHGISIHETITRLELEKTGSPAYSKVMFSTVGERLSKEQKGIINSFTEAFKSSFEPQKEVISE